jgi:hypothetical protein
MAISRHLRRAVLLAAGAWANAAMAGGYDGAAGTPGSLAVAQDDPAIVAWATGFADLVRGPAQIGDLTKGYASFGAGEQTLGAPAGDVYDVVSLGDGGSITLTFARPIADGAGWDFAVFENGHSDAFLELAVVEVSSNGVDFFRFEAVSETPVAPQVGGFGTLDPTNLHNLAGKYRLGYGTPFDLAELAERSSLLDVGAITHVRIIDVGGTVDPAHATLDSLGRVINDPWPTPFATGGFDLDAVGVRHVAAVTGYAAWRGARFTVEELADTAVSGDEADPDHDGRVNLLEYALGTEPRDPADGAANTPALAFAGGTRLTLACVVAAGRADIDVRVEWTDVLPAAVWSAAPEYVSAPLAESVAGGTRLTFTAIKTLAEAPRQFLRLRVSLK